MLRSSGIVMIFNDDERKCVHLMFVQDASTSPDGALGGQLQVRQTIKQTNKQTNKQINN